MAPPSTELQGLWKGKAYHQGWRGRRLLLVAEALPEAAAGFRIGRGLEAQLVQSYVDGSMKNRQFTDAARLVIGEAAERPVCADFFESVALVNLPGLPLRKHPSEEDWAEARTHLENLLLELQPDAVLLLGIRLAEELREVCTGEKGVSLCLSAPHPGTAGFDFRARLRDTAPLRQSGAAEVSG